MCRSSCQRCSLKKEPEACSFIKKEIRFPLNFMKFSRALFLQNTFRRLLLFVIYLRVSFCKEVLHICLNFLLLEKPTKTHIFYYLFILQIHFMLYIVNAFYAVDQNINTRRNHVSLMRLSNFIYKIMCRTVITNVN